MSVGIQEIPWWVLPVFVVALAGAMTWVVRWILARPVQTERDSGTRSATEGSRER